MEQIMDQMAAVVKTASDFVWNSVLLYVLVFTGILFTIRLGFIQVRKFGAGWRQMFWNGGWMRSPRRHRRPERPCRLPSKPPN